MGHIIGISFGLCFLTIGGMFTGMSPLIIPIASAEQFMKGWNGEPAEMLFRPDWQNIGNACGNGGECD